MQWNDILTFSDRQMEDCRVLAYLYIRQGHYDTARRFLEMLAILTSQKPLENQSPYDFKMLGAVYLELGDYERSLRYLDRALRLDSTNVTTLFNRMKVLFLLGKHEEGSKEALALMECDDSTVSSRAEALYISHRT